MGIPAPSPDARAIVTGASSGIGEALARRLAARGHSLILVARRIDRLKQLADELQDRHAVDVEPVECDLTDATQRAEYIDLVARREISVLCSNAGTGTFTLVQDSRPALEAEAVSVNVHANHEATLAVLPGMLARGSGGILLVGSIAGNQPIPGCATYAATKAFVHTFAEGLGAELRGTGVSCTLLIPGAVRTEYYQAHGLGRMQRAIPGLFWVSADQAAGAALTGVARGRRVVVPGLAAKGQTFLGRHLPRAPLLYAADKSMRMVSGPGG